MNGFAFGSKGIRDVQIPLAPDAWFRVGLQVRGAMNKDFMQLRIRANPND